MSELTVGSLSGLAANSYVIDVASGSSLDLSNGATLPAGSIIAVKHALFTGTQTNSTASGANFAITDLSITHTLTNASNKLIVSAFVGVAQNANDTNGVGIALANDGTLVNVGTSVGSRTATTVGPTLSPTTNQDDGTSLAFTYVYEPGDTSSHTYTLRAVNMRVDTQPIYINRGETDTDSSGIARGVSSLVIQEVQA